MIGQQIGGYRILRLLGEGGMGVVYEAVREDIGGSAAIKILKKEYALQPELAARFFNEARAANLVNHPGIVQVFDYGHLPSGAAYLAMELLEGESLYKRLVQKGRLSESETLRLGRQIASALAAAHDKQVVHRDLKPENVLIIPDAEAAGGERAKILDFGIAKLTADHQGAVRTNTNMLMGTPMYMSPEQCRGSKTIGDRTDVYSFGVMLYELLTGRTPFVAEDPGEYIGQHIYKDPPPISSLISSLNPALQRLVESMLQKEPQARPAMAVVARVLKELGNFSSDVVSVRALVEAQGERAPRSRVQQAPVPKPTVIPSGDALPARPAPTEGAEPDPYAKTGVFRNQEPAAPDAGSSPPDQTASTQILPTVQAPPAAPELANRGASARPQWQTLNVVKAVIPEKADAAALLRDEAAERRRKPSFGRMLRRLQLRIKRRLYRWLGVPLSVPPGTSDDLRVARTRRWVMLITALAALLLVAALLILFLRPDLLQ